MGEISEDLHDDTEGLDASAAHIANLLSTEPTDGKPAKSYIYISSCLSRPFDTAHHNL